MRIMGLDDFIQTVRSLTPDQVKVMTDTAAALQRDRYVIDTHGDGSELQQFDRYHQAVARVNTAAGPEYRKRLRDLWKVWDAANTVQDRTARAVLKNAGQAIVLADVLADDVFDAVTAPLRAALGEGVSIPAGTTPAVEQETPVAEDERAARTPEAL